MTSQSSQVWFIVGSSTGFGLSMAKFALQKGNKVVASVRKADALVDLQAQYPDTLLVVVFDTKNYGDVSKGFELAKQKFGRIDVVFNNAGIVILGELEGTSEEAARSVFDVNFWGAVNVSREAVKAFREQEPKGGRLLQVSSNSALECPPGFGFYSATKAALEAVSESLAREVDPQWNIKVTMIEPGPFKSEAASSAQYFTDHPMYTSPTRPMAQFIQSILQPSNIGNVDDATPIFYEVANLPEPPLRFPIHPGSVRVAREKAELIKRDVDAYESWSSRLHFQT